VAGASGLQAPSTTAAGAGPLGCKWPWRLPAALGVFMKLTLLIAIAGVVLALIDFFGWARHGERAVRSFVGWMLSGGNWLTTTLYYLGWGALIAFIEGPHVTLHERASETLALAVHELATNAVKYGALASSQARLKVSWSIKPGALEVEWHESGLANAPSNNARGYGRELIEVALPFALGATTRLDFLHDGVYCSIQLPDYEWQSRKRG
jgi:hypothetical protein